MGFAAFALPGVIALVEDRSFLLDSSDPGRPDLLSRRVAHEVAHQWWGYRLVPPNGAGASLLVESLAKYSELKVSRRLRGDGEVRRFLELELDRYLAGRGNELHAEQPLARVGAQGYISYAKGSLVFNAIRDEIGEAMLDAALRQLLAVSAPTSADLVAALRAAAPDRAEMIDDWLRRVVLYDLAVERAIARRAGEGRWEVAVTITAARRLADGSGRETSVELDEAIDVAVLDGDPATGAAAVIHRERCTLRSGTNALSLLVDRAPAFAIVDPDLLRIETDRSDNTRAVTRPE
jgi:aminopeptidase N